MVTVRRAGRLDTRDMADLLNQIILKGGSTALTSPVSAADLAAWMQSAPEHSAWHVAEDENGRILGFQYIEPHPDLPPDTCDIASYVRPGETGIGIGSALFAATSAAARTLGYRAIIAVIRQDNAGGLAYYQSRGFEDWRDWPDAPVAPRICKRFDL
ncbi:GNAT family N-acetyltransferase [Puniceibacterium confluentis]|uniref:GNAT family N-acetyltransferase n=1 Tax=Puniceibacterium confluentis TaxID=1958944 RepID=UPI0011B8186B|nr:GNAT family N-acetyltransferase [Puniceibacterium confluentis]